MERWGDSVKLSELDLMEFLPTWMRSDENAKALAYAVQKQLKAIIGQISKLAIYTAIQEQPDAILDELGWQFNIPEYDSDLPIVTKRALVQFAILTHKQRGTVAAVERIVTDIFGNGYVDEWFDYDGEPYHFRVHTSNVSAGDQEAAYFESIVASSQNVRSYLEAVIIESVMQMDLYVGGYLRTAESIYI